jgi:hypothetical protein
MATRLGTEKLEALRQLFATLPPPSQQRLAEVLASVRHGDPDFPAELIATALPDGLAPAEPLAEDAPAPLDPARRYTLKELVCLGLDPFLAEETGPTLVPGRIPRSAVEPWWEAMLRMGVEEMDALEAALASAYEEDGDIAAFAHEARRKVSLWSDAFVEKLGQGKTLVSELRTMFSENLVREHVGEITRVMRCCEPILAALARIAPGGEVAELDEAAAAQAAPIYAAAASKMGADARYLAFALFNRLAKPWQIMRLAAALGWTRAAGAKSRNGEMTALCERLIPMLVELANTIKAGTAQETLASTEGAFVELRQLVLRYAQVADALAAEVDFRKDSAWGAQIIRSREAMRSAFDAEPLDVMENIIVGFMPSVLEAEAPPPEPAIGHAVAAARLLMAVVHHGQHHGFGNDAGVLVGKLGKELERLIEMLLTKPQGHEPQLDGAVKVLSILFPDLRTQALAKRVAQALGRTATP